MYSLPDIQNFNVHEVQVQKYEIQAKYCQTKIYTSIPVQEFYYAFALLNLLKLCNTFELSEEII